jgi:hypothetical protein
MSPNYEQTSLISRKTPSAHAFANNGQHVTSVEIVNCISLQTRSLGIDARDRYDLLSKLRPDNNGVSC